MKTTASGVTLPGTELHELRSRQLNRTFEIRVAIPVRGWRSPPVDEWPVVYVLDGDLFFGTVVEMTRLMHQLFGELPPLLVVGVAYGTSDPQLQGELRNRDFTPTVDPEFERMGRRLMPDWKPTLPEGERMGGAGAFLKFLREELEAFLRQRYPIAEGGSTLFGASLGGLFAVYTLLTAPESFDAYVISSPALWWDEELMFRVESERAGTRDDLKATVFLGVGSLEEGTGIPWLDRFRTVSNVHRLAGRLESRGYPSLELTTHVFEGETHTSVVPAVITRGLRAVYGRRVRVIP